MQLNINRRPIVYQDAKAVGAGVTENNLIQDSRLVQSPRSGILGIAMNGSATGLRVTVVVGSDEVVIDSAVNAFNRQIETDSDFLARGIPVRAGERITVKVSNPTAGSLTVSYRLVLK